MYEVAQHAFAHIEVRDHAVFERTDCSDVIGRAANHAFGIVADGKGFAVVDIHRDDRRFIENYAFTTYVDQGVGGAKVDRHISAYEPCNAIKELAHQSDRLMDDSENTESARIGRLTLGILCQDMPLL